ncbi:MAG: glucose-6-phosphate isomerase family protein [ANME-2 cluster archaeon]|nr:glucose-6-phosphate isomerase family protein [ANME-2 cluster archaeon]
MGQDMDRTLTYGGRTYEPTIRMLSDIAHVLLDARILEERDRELYYMYRDLALSRSDRETILEHELRYDITVIPPAMIGREYVKTLGHYHPPAPGIDHSYPEVYEVLSGECHYLLQKHEGEAIVDVVMIRASAGDKVIIPPDYGHVTINACNKELKMANWVSRDFTSVYEPFIELHGAAYYLTVDGLIANPNYGDVPGAREVEPGSFSEVGLVKGKEMYGLVRDIRKLDFLNRPQDFGWLFEKVLI